MTTYDFDPEKNVWLKETRGIGFEEIIALIEDKRLIEVRNHHNSARYPNQFVYVVDGGDYVYLVPHVVTPTGVFLKTLYQSRKATKQRNKGMSGRVGRGENTKKQEQRNDG